MCVSLTHIIRDYMSSTLILHVNVTHTYELNLPWRDRRFLRLGNRRKATEAVENATSGPH